MVDEIKQEVPRAPANPKQLAALAKARETRAANIEARKASGEVTGKDVVGVSDIRQSIDAAGIKSLWSSAYVAALQSCAINHPSKTNVAIALADQAVKDFEVRFPK